MTKFSTADRERINTAIAAAELKTSAEIVPVIAESSGRYDRAEDAWGACLGVICFLVVDLVVLPRWIPLGHWSEFSVWPVTAQLGALFIGALIGIVLSNRVPGLRRFFITRAELIHEVTAQARQVFFDQRIHHTGGRSGVLIFISLFERKAVVLTDEVVLQIFGQPFVDTWCADLTNRLKTLPVMDAMEQTIAQIGSDLATALPGSVYNANELPDALITTGEKSC